MLQAWGFDRIGVVAGDLYFVDPNPGPGQEGPERGVRLEVRVLERPPLTGSIYAAQPIVIDRPIWRADLLETVEGPAGSHDRTHHHPRFRGWEPGKRQYDPGITSDPLGWLVEQLSDLTTLIAGAELDAEVAGPDDARLLAEAAPAIGAAVSDLLARVRKGDLAQPVEAEEAGGVRAGWL